MLSALVCAFGATGASAQNVTTYHYDNQRTGWNQNETSLTQASVGSGGSFKLLSDTPLDDQVDAQPLIVTNQTIIGQGTHDVVYVATESNSVYALDASTGAVLLQVNLGAPVPFTRLPGQCTNNGPNVGITSTPVIDRASSTLYVVAYSLENNNPVFRLHGLDLASLTDKMPSVLITATGKLVDGSTYQFDPAVTRQRAGLLLANNNVYAGFASYCDVNADRSRGWVLGWNAATLAPLPANELTNKLASSLNNYFLTGIWMSGYGLAASQQGNIYFVTGNSDYSGNSFNAVTNIAESVASVSGDLSVLKSVFTPSNHAVLDQVDADFGSGGVMLVPAQSRTRSNPRSNLTSDAISNARPKPDPNPGPSSGAGYAVAAGKDGMLYLLNGSTLNSIASYDIGGCLCGPSYFQGHDGVGRVVTSGGDSIGIWNVSSKNKGKLILERSLPNIDNGQAPGFFTSVSSNGTSVGTAVIWAVGKPLNSNPAEIKLYAFNADTGAQLFSAVAGNWANVNANANIVPVVANGKVYVASNQQLAIFGVSAGPAAPLAQIALRPAPRAQLAAGEHEIYATVLEMYGTTLLVEKRNGDRVYVDASEAERKFRLAEPSVGHALIARGRYDSSGVLRADTLLHAKDNRQIWLPDR